MTAGAGWQRVLTSPRPGEHVLQLHTDTDRLATSVAGFIGEGVRRGDAGIVIATPAHRESIEGRLAAAGLVPADLQRRGALVMLDAATCLARFAADGRPDPVRFHATLGDVVDAALARGHERIRAFGEMVDLLRHHSLDGALRLEALWEELLATRPVALLCAYTLDHLDRRAHRDLVPRIARAHSHFVPAEDGDRLARAVERAHADVFGLAGDPQRLRRLLTDQYGGAPDMPEAAAALLAAREMLPVTADLLLDRVGVHYRA